ncbi:hypothetical protein BGZ76_008253 [Entomortierella beljakovae]|nr:hypothetical protein BGZ76_008253 [Entomortierella beljakovae]
MFNTDSGFRPPSPLNFPPPSNGGLFGESFGFDDFKIPNQDFLNLTNTPPPGLASDPSAQLFNSSEQRYFSEFLDTLVVDQDFTFDPSLIPNLPNLPLFNQESMIPSGLNPDNSYAFTSSSSSSLGSNPSMPNSNAMDFDLTSPSSQSSFTGSHSFPNHYSHRSDSPASPDSPSSSNPYTLSSATSAPNKRRTNKGESRRISSNSQDSTKITTPIQQLSNLSLNGTSNASATNYNGSSSSSSGAGTFNPKKIKRDEYDHPSPSSPSFQSRDSREDRHERHGSTPDGFVSDSTTNAPVSAQTKRKPYKELLTEEEKRANHIASEQKRRNTIRTGFKDMTEIIPDLKDVNSSKSTILFKAVDFIRHLERQNRTLQEKANRLESRLMNSKKNDNNVPGIDDRLQEIPHIYPVPCNR